MTHPWRPALVAGWIVTLALAAVAVRGQAPATAPATESANAPATAPATGPATSPSTAPSTAPATATAPAATLPAVPKPPDAFELADVPKEADVATAAVRAVRGNLGGHAPTDRAAADLPPLADRVAARFEESGRLVRGNPSLETLREQEDAWEATGETLTGWLRDLTARANQLGGHVTNLANLEKRWRPTLAHAETTRAPPDVVARVRSVADDLARARQEAERARDRVLSLQARADETAARARDALAAVRDARGRAVNRMFVRDSKPIWEVAGDRDAGQALVQQGQRSFEDQAAELRGYVEQQGGWIALHLAAWAALVPVVFAVRRRVRPWAQEDGSVRRAAAVFDTPVATATLLALLGSGQIYPHAPRLFWSVVMALALVPAIVILRRLLERRLFPILTALVLFYAADRVRQAAAGQPLPARVLLMLEMVGGALFLAWLIRSGRLSHVVGGDDRDALGWWVTAAVRVSGVAFVAAFTAAALGYVTLANLLGNATLGSAYLAVVLYAATRIADGLLMASLRVRPLGLLTMVQRHRKLIWQRAHRLVQWGAAVWWAAATLEMFNVRALVVGWVERALHATLTVGTFSVSAGQVLGFVLAVYAAVLVSRFARFVLEEDVYPRSALPRGMPYAINSVLHYAILAIGLVAAVGVAGGDLTKFTILAGAFGVGLGFGLQNIFNNFVSGLILLFERPVKVGDVIQVGPDIGVVRRIGIRASFVRTASGAEIILPNGRLISDPVTNWTLSSQGRGIELAVGVAPGTEPRQVMLLWKRVAADHPKVAEDPPARAVVVALAADAVRFELRAWTTEFETWTETRSDLAIAMNAALADAGIGMK